MQELFLLHQALNPDFLSSQHLMKAGVYIYFGNILLMHLNPHDQNWHNAALQDRDAW